MKDISKVCPICNSTSPKVAYKDLYDDRFAYPNKFDLMSCAECHHHFLDAHFSSDELKDLYTNYYPRSSFDVNSYKPLQYSPGFKSWFNGQCHAFSYVPTNCKVLDIGCGFGESVGYHKLRGCEAYGCEADANAKKVADQYALNIRIGIFEDLKYEENFFDFVTMDQVFEHATNPQSLLNAIYMVLKPGGKLVLSYPNALGWGAKKYKHRWLHWHTPYHLHFFSKKSLSIIAKNAKMNLISYKTHTSSEWLFYQKMHNTTFPDFKEPSRFFNSYKTFPPLPSKIDEQQTLIQRCHRKKWNHITTRFFDMIGAGDNTVAILQKPQVS